MDIQYLPLTLIHFNSIYCPSVCIIWTRKIAYGGKGKAEAISATGSSGPYAC
jgi:hypothetical protein